MSNRDKPTLPPPNRASSASSLAGRLTAQQSSLIKAFVTSDRGFLNHSYYLDPVTRRRTALALEPGELSRFTAAWAVEPVACIQFFNEAIGELHDESRFARYIDAAVDLEQRMDRETFRSVELRIHRGIPSYFMDGYTDMGLLSTPAARPAREKIKVSKIDVRDKLAEAKRLAVLGGTAAETLLVRYYEIVRRDLVFDDPSVASISAESGDSSVSLSRYFERGVGVCRHLAITYQLYLQEAGIASRLVKGNLRLFGLKGRHAWNVAFILGRVAVIDVTLPDLKGPFIITAGSQEEAYRLAATKDRSYVATPDDNNHYKIAPVDGGTLLASEVLESYGSSAGARL